MPIDGQLDSGYKSPCLDCPYEIGKESKQSKDKGYGTNLRKKCKNCKYRLALIEVMDKDPIPIQTDTDFIQEKFTRDTRGV